MRDYLTKADLLAAQQCLGMAWRELRAEPVSPDEAGRFRMRQGQEVGELARVLYPDGVLVSSRESHAAATLTRSLIQNGTATMFEATALAAPFLARADVLTRMDAGWHVFEVKSSFSDTDRIDALIDDLAYTVMVFQRFGVMIARASLLLLSREYRHGDDASRLFHEVDVTAEALERAAVSQGSAGSIARALFQDVPPDPKLGPACRQCSEFGTECLGAALEHTVLEIPGLHYKKLQQLAAAGVVDIANLPADFKLNDSQRRAVRSARSGELCLEDGLEGALGAIAWPCYYLDFETVSTALPLYPGHGCHQQVLTQFSIHRRDRTGDQLQHEEFLADAARDCQRELAEALIRTLGQCGSILVYSGFEQTRIKSLQQLFPDLAAPLQAILDRLLDLLSIVKSHVYHPEFHGSFSIKKVLPALVAGFSYDDLDIRNGDAAIAQFARMARGETAGEAVHLTQRQLLAYCERDTLAMVRLHEVLIDLASGRIARGA